MEPFSPANLLTWYYAYRREMPWRGHPDPYAVWVSEVMLQQTQVETVRPYFTRFLQAFPTLPALAAATDDALLKAWEGLGYYSRARNLRKAAQILTSNGGQLPQQADALEALPGIGPYTAAAIASICFGERVPVVDGNVIRVFARHNALPDDFSKMPSRKALATWLHPFITQPNVPPADFNQAMMELGALVCTPRHPTCSACPLKRSCQAYAENRVADFPHAAAKKTLPTRREKVALAFGPNGEVLLQRQSGGRLLAGLWALPTCSACPFITGHGRKVHTFRQDFTHFHLRLTIYRYPKQSPTPLPPNFCWAVSPVDLPLTTATRKILAALNCLHLES